jgi:hypothetical protein
MDNTSPSRFPNELDVLAEFVSVLDSLNIPYALGGSMAGSVYGKVRFTENADITVEPFLEAAEALVERLSPAFYVSRQAVCQALNERSSFNVIHIAAAFKIDVFIRNETPFQKDLLLRRRQVSIPGLSQPVWAVSPEDILLLKLSWYQQGGEVSDKQWNDILGLLEVQKDKLNLTQLRRWAVELGVIQLLDKALTQAK